MRKIFKKLKPKVINYRSFTSTFQTKLIESFYYINSQKRFLLITMRDCKAEVLNKFFSNIVNNLEISKYSKYESFIDDIEDQTIRVIFRDFNLFIEQDINDKK